MRFTDAHTSDIALLASLSPTPEAAFGMKITYRYHRTIAIPDN